MLRDDVDEELDVERPRKDVELTLGPAVLFALVCGLILLCGLCFGVGYTSGRRSGARTASAKEAAAGQTLAAQAAAARKPAAAGTPPMVQAAGTENAQSSTSSLPTGGASPQATSASSPNGIRPAIESQAGQPQSPLTQGSGVKVQPALPPGSGVMVQIAAVSHVEDANVLMAALRRHGYEVTARREADDNLIHVQVGPFATRNEASAMSQRLLSDGYNAVVLP